MCDEAFNIFLIGNNDLSKEIVEEVKE